MNDLTIYTIGDNADAVGHVDLNDTRVVFGPPDNMLPSSTNYPLADARGIVLGKHRDYPAATSDEFIVILGALMERWPDRPIYLWGETGLTAITPQRMH